MNPKNLFLFALGGIVVLALGFALLPSGTPRQPVHVVLFFDTSGSADAEVARYRLAAFRLSSSLRPRVDHLTIARFDRNASEVSGPSIPASEEELLDLIDIALHARSGRPITKQEAPLLLAERFLRNSTHEAVIVVLTDGGHDDFSSQSHESLREVASQLSLSKTLKKVIYAGTRVGNRELLRNRLTPLGSKLRFTELTDLIREVQER